MNRDIPPGQKEKRRKSSVPEFRLTRRGDMKCPESVTLQNVLRSVPLNISVANSTFAQLPVSLLQKMFVTHLGIKSLVRLASTSRYFLFLLNNIQDVDLRKKALAMQQHMQKEHVRKVLEKRLAEPLARLHVPNERKAAMDTWIAATTPDNPGHACDEGGASSVSVKDVLDHTLREIDHRERSLNDCESRTGRALNCYMALAEGKMYSYGLIAISVLWLLSLGSILVFSDMDMGEEIAFAIETTAIFWGVFACGVVTCMFLTNNQRRILGEVESQTDAAAQRLFNASDGVANYGAVDDAGAAAAVPAALA